MKSLTQLSYAALLIAACFSANANDNESKLNNVKTALMSMPAPINVPHTRTETTFDDDESITTISRITPNSNPIWELISVNGETPSKKEIKKFDKQMEKQLEDQEKDPFIGMLNLDSLTHFENTDKFDVYDFDPIFSAFKDEAKYDLDGRVFVDQTGVIQSITINAPETFKPVFGATMHTFLLEYKIAYNNITPYVQTYKVLIDAKIGGFKKMHVESNGTNSDIAW